MMEPFAILTASGDPIADVTCYYENMDLLETLHHVTQVAAQAQNLAGQHDVNPASAHLAALAHDLAAGIPAEEMPSVAEQMGILVSDVDRAIPSLLHGPIAAAALETKLGLDDEDVLNAIRYHSTLRAGASSLEKVVFLADKIAYDPTSPHQGEYLSALQSAASLDEAALIYLDFLLDNAWRYKWYPHPNALAAYRELVKTLS